MCRNLETNTRKIKSNIDKYSGTTNRISIINKKMRYVLYRTDVKLGKTKYTTDSGK